MLIFIKESAGKFMENNRPEFEVHGLAIDCKDAKELCKFYHNLLEWEETHEGGGWFGLTSPHGVVLAFQTTEEYEPPVWPYEKGKQGQMLHLDFFVKNLDEAVNYAIKLGAKVASAQFYEEYGCKTMLDPEGHPFCIATSKG